jgi:biotin carboxylase
MDVARALHHTHPIHAVVGYDDQAVPVVAHIATDLELPGHPVEAAYAARDKVVMKQRFNAARIPIASYTLAADEADAIQWANQEGYPVVVKPVRGSASQGVVRANDENELREAYRRVQRIVREFGLDTGGRSYSEQLVERYLDGHEVSVELVVQEGAPHVLCLFEKPLPLEGPFFEETIYLTPTRLAPDVCQEIQDIAVRAVLALGLRSGAAHCELRLSSAGPFVLEVGGRLIGGACSRVLSYALGEDIHSHVLRLALGDQLPALQQQPSATGAMMLPIPGEGRLVGIRGVEHARQIPGIQDVLLAVGPGDAIVPFPEQSCYIGFLTATAETPQEVQDALVKASSQIDFDLEPLNCIRWTRDIDDHRSYEPSTRHCITSLAAHDLEAARDIVIPIIAAAHFVELPHALALEEARHCVHWLEGGIRGETSPAFWLVAEDRGVALGSSRGETAYVSCLGVVPGALRSGLGEALVRSIMALFAQRGCKHLEVLLDPRSPASNGL